MDKRLVLEEIVKELVDDSKGVKVEEIIGQSATVYNIRVSKGDLGKVVGRKGRIITAIRTIIGSIFAKNDQKVIIEVND